MNKKLPKVFQNDIGEVRNNAKVFHEGKTDVDLGGNDVNSVIESIFTSPNHIYKTGVWIKTNDGVFDYDIIGRTRSSLITIDNKLIDIKDIQDIKIKGLK